MCGIAGFIDVERNLDSAEQLIDSMCKIIRHRGPGDQGVQYLAEYVSSLPSTIRTRNGVLKYLLKKVAANMLPAEILTRRKQGFGVPIKHWFRSDLTTYAYDLLNSPRARQRGIFNPDFIANLLKAHASTKLVNHSDALWALLCLELWFEVCMDQPPPHVERGAQTQIVSNR